MIKLENELTENSIRSFLNQRDILRKNKNWIEADQIANYLYQNNIIIFDHKDRPSSYEFKNNIIKDNLDENLVNNQSNVENLLLKKGRHSKVKNQKRRKTKKRGKIFADWLINTFDSSLFVNGVLDVAGGKGEVSYHLCKNKIKSIVIDPMKLKLSANKTKKLITCDDSIEIDQKYQYTESTIMDEWNKECLEDYRLTWLDIDTILEKIKFGFELSSLLPIIKKNLDTLNLNHQKILFKFDSSLCDSLVQGSSFLVGFHPDQATEDIIDYALKYDKPFAVVPCCVFPSLFPNRKCKEGKLVRTFDQFLNYLKAKNPKIQSEIIIELTGPNNICLYYTS